MPSTAQLQNSAQPDTSYLPDRKKYRNRVSRRLEEEELPEDSLLLMAVVLSSFVVWIMISILSI